MQTQAFRSFSLISVAQDLLRSHNLAISDAPRVMKPFKPEDCLILIVDDVSQNLQLMGKMLEQVSYETTFATSGQQALERVKTAKPDLILLDLMMPGMNGLEVCEKLKANPNFCQIPIIFLTASSEIDNLVEAFKKGASDYITKPFRPEEVLIRIETQLNNQRLKKQIEVQNKQLQTEIEARRRTEAELQEAKAAAEAANRFKSVFLANMSHELRTPLNAIFGFTQLMQNSSNLTSEQQKNFNIIRRSGEHLLNLINDILNLSKIEAGRITLNANEFNLIEMLLELEEMFRIKTIEKGLELELVISPNLPASIVSDRLKIRQVLINLISNAIKFTKSGKIILRVSVIRGELFVPVTVKNEPNIEYTNTYPLQEPLATDSEQLTLQFEISDTGVGIPPEDLNNIFQPFVQSQAGFEAAEGTGLGLAISHRYVKLLGGNLNVNSQLGVGTTFKFQITVNPIETVNNDSKLSLGRVISLAPNQPRYRILVVDDKLTNRELLVQMLSQVGFDIRSAENGQQAIEIWEFFEPHLIFMDMEMPVMNGYEATQKIKATLKGKNTVIFALTASVFEEQKGEILSAGCEYIIHKPFLHRLIFDKLAEYLGVVFVCEDSVKGEKIDGKSTLNLSVLSHLPDSLLNQLEKSALALDEQMLYDLIAQIEQQETDIAKVLKDYTDDFQYDKILEAIAQVKNATKADK